MDKALVEMITKLVTERLQQERSNSKQPKAVHSFLPVSGKENYVIRYVMKAEYEAFSSAFDSMDEEEKKILLPYISKKSSREDIADERGVTTDAVNQRIKRIKKNLKSKVIYSMREYN